jgi:hypothetical protein
LDTQNIFYPFLNLAVICKKRKINLLKKNKEHGPSDGHSPGRPRSAACPGLARLNRYAAVRSRSDGARPSSSRDTACRRGGDGELGFPGDCKLTEGMRWSTEARSVAERLRWGFLARGRTCRGWGASGGVEVFSVSSGRRWRWWRRLQDSARQTECGVRSGERNRAPRAREVG